MNRPIRVPQSAKSDITAAARRCLSSVTTTSAAPTGSDKGFPLNSPTHIRVTVELPDSGSSLSWKLWVLDETSGKWCEDTTVGTVSETQAGGIKSRVFSAHRAVAVYVQITAAASMSTGANFWISEHDE